MNTRAAARPRRKPPLPPERSKTLRLLVIATALPPLLALAWAGFLWLPLLITLAGLAAGHVYSYRAAENPRASNLVRLMVFVALHLALAWMCAGLFIGAALPQAQFAMYAQAITAFDVRTRRNLFASLALSLLVLYVAATLSRGTSLLVFALAYTVAGLAVFFRAEYEEGASRSTAIGRRAPLSDRHVLKSGRYSLLTTNLRPLASFTLFALFGSTLVFAFTPHFSSRPVIPPFSLNLPIPRGVTSQIVNPALPLVQINGWSDDTGEYYYGFDSQLDLSYRGGLADTVVMYVRSPAWSYWRSHSYDTYDGRAWRQADHRLTDLSLENQIYFSIPADAQALGEEVVQTFYLVRQQPNLVFAAYRPVEAYLNTRALVLDAGDGLRVGEPMQAGTTYTIISRRPNFEAEALRAAGGAYPASVAERYLQLPPNVSPRVRALAASLTAGSANPYDQAAALRDHLLTIPYDFFPPPQPPGSETVDNFLFVDQRGVCEHFVTAHVVMLRILGIPARLAAGYGAGQYNALSGYYTVRASDAHAWTEVYFPGYGWVPFDPTPGWTPNPYTAPVQRWLFSSGMRGLPSLPFGALASMGRFMLGAASAPVTLVAALLLFVVAGWLLHAILRRRRGARLPEFSLIDGDPQRRRVLAAYRAAQKRTKRYRASAETPREFAERLAHPAWEEVTAAVEQAAYAATPPSRSVAERITRLARRLTNTLREPE